VTVSKLTSVRVMVTVALLIAQVPFTVKVPTFVLLIVEKFVGERRLIEVARVGSTPGIKVESILLELPAPTSGLHAVENKSTTPVKAGMYKREKTFFTVLRTFFMESTTYRHFLIYTEAR